MNSDSSRWLAMEFDQWMNANLFLIPNWKWGALLIALIAGLLLKSILTKVFRLLKNANWARVRATGFLLHFLETDLQKPLAWIITAAFWWVSLDALDLPGGLKKYLFILVQLIFSIHVIVLAYKAAEAVGKLIFKISVRSGAPLDDQLAQMVTKVLKVLVLIMGLLVMIQNFGVNVMSIIAGLGLGGLALALAAQDTAANLFGSVTIMADRPFRIGDFIQIGDTIGVVEDIGFRSTRIRTVGKSLITLPNSTVAKEKIENYQTRTQRRIRQILGLTYATKEAQMRAYMQELEAFLKAHPKVEQETWAVRFFAMGDFNLQVLVQFFIFSNEWNDEVAVQEEFFFHAMKSAEKVGVEFAFPTQTHHVNIERLQIKDSNQSIQ